MTNKEKEIKNIEKKRPFLRDAVRGCFPLGKNNRKSRDAEEGYPRRRHTQDSTQKNNTENQGRRTQFSKPTKHTAKQ